VLDALRATSGRLPTLRDRPPSRPSSSAAPVSPHHSTCAHEWTVLGVAERLLNDALADTTRTPTEVIAMAAQLFSE